MDVGPTGVSAGAGVGVGEDVEDLLVFVDRLAAAARSEEITVRAQEQVGQAVATGEAPPGLRRLAEALAASMVELPPAPRTPVDDTAAIVPAMRGHALVVLADADPAAVAMAVAALIADGRRVVVTAESDAELDGVRAGIPDAGTLDRLPALAPADVRRLRRLLATSTASGRARAAQQLPAPDELPAVDDVERWCAQAAQDQIGSGVAALVPVLLAEVEAERRDAVTSVARCVRAKLDALGPHQQQPWTWELLGDLIHSRHRAAFDRTQEDIAQALAVVERDRGGPAVRFRTPPAPDTADVLCRYLDFLESGGRSRAYFRSAAQREVAPVLRGIEVGGRTPEYRRDVVLVLGHLELDERLARIDTGCVQMGVPAPQNPAELARLADDLGRVGAAARSVGALRHDVLFLAADSPLAVPDVDTADRIAAAICEYAERGSAAEAAELLDRAAAVLEERATVAATSPEHQRAVQALRDRDAVAYAAAVEQLGSARRELRDETRRGELLAALRAHSPELATSWAETPTSGLAAFTRAELLLQTLPPPDSADVVVVLGAARLGVQRLLLTAVAPRMIAVVGPGEDADGAPTLLSVLLRASALVVQGGTARSPGQVLQLNSPRAGAGATPVGQAGA